MKKALLFLLCVLCCFFYSCENNSSQGIPGARSLGTADKKNLSTLNSAGANFILKVNGILIIEDIRELPGMNKCTIKFSNGNDSSSIVELLITDTPRITWLKFAEVEGADMKASLFRTEAHTISISFSIGEKVIRLLSDPKQPDTPFISDVVMHENNRINCLKSFKIEKLHDGFIGSAVTRVQGNPTQGSLNH
jgi:hypothetical protein